MGLAVAQEPVQVIDGEQGPVALTLQAEIGTWAAWRIRVGTVIHGRGVGTDGGAIGRMVVADQL